MLFRKEQVPIDVLCKSIICKAKCGNNPFLFSERLVCMQKQRETERLLSFAELPARIQQKNVTEDKNEILIQLNRSLE